MPPAQLESLQPHISDLELSQGENPLVPDHDFRDEQNFNRPTTDGSDVVRDFFVNDDGRSVLDNISAGPLRSLPGNHSIRSIVSAPGMQSLASVNTVVSQEVLVLPLHHLCEVIVRHRSLVHAEITMTETYAEQIGIITHRFLLLELHRGGGKKPIWLRLDRRTGHVSAFKFLRESMTTPSNDIGQLAATKEELIGAGKRENRQIFYTLPTLGELRVLLLVICEEIKTYTVWPANCWFFCSLLQEHLEGTNEGAFVNGRLKHAGLAQDVRRRVRSRLQYYYHVPSPPASLTERLRSMSGHDLVPLSPPIGAILILAEEWDKVQEPKSMDIHLGIQLAQNLQLSAAQLTDSTQCSEARIFSEYSVNILRQLHNRYPRRKQIRTALSDALQTYTISLGKSWRTGDACLVSEECVALRRITYKSSRKQNRLKMVVSLVLRGICLRDMYRFEDALSVFSEAVVLARKIAPAENTFNLSITLCHYGMCLLDLGEFSNASSVLNEAFIFNQGSDESVEQARSSSSLSPVFPTADGVSMAISHWRLMFNNGGDQFRAIYLMSLEKLGDVLGILLFTEAAQKARAEAQWVRSLTRS